jgi:hypothetical protein
MSEPSFSSPTRTAPRPPVGPHAENDAASQTDRVAAETLIRTTVQGVGNGSVPQDLDDLVRRNAGRVTREDLRAGRLDSSVLGDIINSVEQAKGNSAINWHAATPQQIKAYLTAHGLSALGAHRLLGSGPQAGEGASRDAKGGEGQSGARFGEISKTAMEARDIALSHGMGWAANNRELLKMGPAATQALADVHFAKESYERLRSDVSFTAKDTVALARYAKEKKVDANELSTALADVGRGLSREEKANLRAGIVPHLSKPADPSARKAADDALAAVGRGHPEKKPAIERARRLLNVHTGAELRQRNAESKQLNQETSSAVQSATNLDALNGGGDEAKPATAKNGSTPQAAPTTKATERKSGMPIPAQREAAAPKAPSPGTS